MGGGRHYSCPTPSSTSSGLRAACGVESARPSGGGDTSIRGVFGPDGQYVRVTGPRHKRYDHFAESIAVGTRPIMPMS